MDEKFVAEVVKAAVNEIKPQKLTLEMARRLIKEVEKKAAQIGSEYIICIIML